MMMMRVHKLNYTTGLSVCLGLSYVFFFWVNCSFILQPSEAPESAALKSYLLTVNEVSPAEAEPQDSPDWKYWVNLMKLRPC